MSTWSKMCLISNLKCFVCWIFKEFNINSNDVLFEFSTMIIEKKCAYKILVLIFKACNQKVILDLTVERHETGHHIHVLKDTTFELFLRVTWLASACLRYTIFRRHECYCSCCHMSVLWWVVEWIKLNWTCTGEISKDRWLRHNLQMIHPCDGPSLILTTITFTKQIYSLWISAIFITISLSIPLVICLNNYMNMF